MYAERVVRIIRIEEHGTGQVICVKVHVAHIAPGSFPVIE